MDLVTRMPSPSPSINRWPNLGVSFLLALALAAVILNVVTYCPGVALPTLAFLPLVILVLPLLASAAIFYRHLSTEQRSRGRDLSLDYGRLIRECKTARPQGTRLMEVIAGLISVSGLTGFLHFHGVATRGRNGVYRIGSMTVTRSAYDNAIRMNNRAATALVLLASLFAIVLFTAGMQRREASGNISKC